MSPSPKPEHTPPVSNLTYLYKHSRNPTVDASRGRNPARHELGRGDRHGERVTRIYPREIANSSPTAKRFSSASPTGPSYNATTSPLLSALGATTKSATQYTNEWTKSLPFFANQASPSNGGIPINGSPPQFHNSPNARAGVYGQAAASASPPALGMNPRSTPDHLTSFGGRLRGSPHESPATDPRDRRASMFSHTGARPASQQFAANPPLPHQPQTHFYNLPDFNLGLNNAAPDGIAAGEEGYFCGFDTLGMAADEAARNAENVILVGYQGGLDVFRVEKGKMDVLGRLEGLRGGVIGAKILPWTSRRDPLSAVRPLIVLTIHGPVLGDNRSSSGSDVPSVDDDGSSASPSRSGSPHGNDAAARITSYQTTVEVYSLKEKCKIAVLYQSPFVSVTSSVDSPLFQPPPPVGDFSVDAKGKFVTVASGASGEVFIFAPYSTPREDFQESFRCIGKVWTTVQPRERVNHASASSAADGSQEDIAPEIFGVPVVSLSERWLVFTPPASTAHFPVNGIASVSAQYERPPGLAHHTVPSQPSVNCAVDAPEAASLINRLTKEGTQVAIKSARWAAEKGLQAYKNYMNKGSSPHGANAYGADPSQQYFPPTHGHNQAPRQEATVISILDLQRLHDAEETKTKTALSPIATFPAALGCSHLSFSPGGLMLMTINKKGDVYEVWDLKRFNFRRARKTTREQATGQHVRQVARFSRMTVSNVVDVVWSAPKIDKVAVITDKGTVHMFLMPASAFQWPPPRRIRNSNDTTAPNAEPTEAGRGNTVNSAIQVLNDTAKPFLNVIRPGSNTNGSRFTFKNLGMTPAAGAKSGKAVAAGVGKQINTIRHAGDNKLTLPTSPSGVKTHSVRWLTGKGRGHIALVAGGVLQIHRVQMRPATGKGKSANENSIMKKKISEFGLLPIRDSVLAPSIAAQLYAQPDEPEQLHDVHGEWIPRALPAHKGRIGPATKQTGMTPAPLSFSEIETNPPYQPFYTDRRVARFVFAQLPSEAQVSSSEYQTPELLSNLHHEDDDTPWLFGEDIEAVRISSPVTQHFDSGDEDALAGVAARIENKLIRRDGEDEIEQVIVTTRRRRTRRDGAEDEEEGFFEDDCEVLDFAEDRV
ncbi:hypothetical protein P171DRAFT_435389 [Karstenula rhodostoma CBS 690.94]|uniref:BCAS3 domain-containing protein n=1 Tax=Karstenula rhodostoma CBS 690.94 TaxID=1392251 RepID=A0A9P4PAS1_9PLEO|nr:hypothetical protein P171DRAFT_435389 [Karstenula rhodostoma CBS 690.94]